MKKYFALALAGIFSLLVLTGCAQEPEVITLTHPAGVSNIHALDLNTEGDLGDMSVFESPLTKDGKPYGEMLGTMTKVGQLGQGTHPEREERLLNAVFDLPDGEITVMGISYYVPSATKLEKNEPVSRAIVGGTGAYAGVQGEVITTHNADDTYTHQIRITK